MAIAVAVVAVALAGAAANVALLSSNGEERLGRLSPIAPSAMAPVAVPAWIPSEGEGEPTAADGPRHGDQDD